MKLLVTGAGGFLGRHVVAAAVRRGHQVRALLRPAARVVPTSWHEHPDVEVVRGDLRSPQGLKALLPGVAGVIHLAAAKTGDLYEQFGSTVLATEKLLNAMIGSEVKRLVVTGSFSVYEYLRLRSWSTLDESSPMAVDPFTRDEYCQTKLAQERLVLERARTANGGNCLESLVVTSNSSIYEYQRHQSWSTYDDSFQSDIDLSNGHKFCQSMSEQERYIIEQSDTVSCRCVVLRPGVLFGKDNLWTARLGMQCGPRWWLRTGAFAPLPLTYVENCAEAHVLAVEYNGSKNPLILNVVDDDPPSQRAYLKELQTHMTPRPRVIPVPWTVMRSLARLAWLCNRLFFQWTAKVPGLLVPSRLHARCKPLRYPNTAIKTSLGWQPRYSWREGVARSLAAMDTAELPAPASETNSGYAAERSPSL